GGDGLDGRRNWMGGCFVHHLFDQVGAVERGVDQVGAACLDEHALRARTDQRPLCLHQDARFWGDGCWDFGDARDAGTAILQNLFHSRGPSDDNRRSSPSLRPTMNSWKAWNTHRASPARPSRKPRRNTYIYMNNASALAGTYGQIRSRKKRLRCTGDASRLIGSRARSGASRSALKRAAASRLE